MVLCITKQTFIITILIIDQIVFIKVYFIKASIYLNICEGS